MSKAVSEARELFLTVRGKHPRALEMADRIEALRQHPAFLRLLNCEIAFKQGLDPVPNRSAHEQFLRACGHEFAAHEVLPRGNFLRNLLNKSPKWENYLALHGLIAARLMVKPGPLSDRQVHALYATIDRFLRGGTNWASVHHVQAMTKRDYQSLGRVSVPVLSNASSSLLRVLEATSPSPLTQNDFRLILWTHNAAVRFVAAMITWNAGRHQATVDDHFQAIDVYLSLFDVNPLDLPPLVREGRSGYER